MTTTTHATMLQTYLFQVYTNHPATGEPGWEIEVGFVLRAKCREEAEKRVSRHYGDRFDTVISCYPVSEVCDLGCKAIVIH